MKKLLRYLNIPELIIKSYQDKLNDDESSLLSDWLEESEENKRLYETLSKGIFSEEEIVINNLGKKRAWRKIEQATGIKKTYSYIRYAAVLLIPLAISGMVLLLMDNYNSDKVLQYSEKKITINAGTNKASLLLATGEVIKLHENKEIPADVLPGVTLNNDDKSLSLSALTDSKAAVVQSTLVIPRGGEYQITLEDGTKVWLNSESKLTFPNVFRGNTRRVQLEGEAYFEVEKNIDVPFIVEVKYGAEIKVIGTKFNISSYNDGISVKTTLIEGSVQVLSYANHNEKLRPQYIILKPGQQSEIDSEGQQHVKEVNTSMAVAWTKGRFVFEEEKLENILIQLGRWYDINVIFEDTSVRDFHFTGDLPRYESIDEILGMLKKVCNKVEFNIERREMTVKARE